METRHPQQHNRRFGSSYRTYEEWKPDFEALYDDGTVGSYRTYEEWKLSQNSISNGRTIYVLTVPMRNGNFFETLTGYVSK